MALPQMFRPNPQIATYGIPGQINPLASFGNPASAQISTQQLAQILSSQPQLAGLPNQVPSPYGQPGINPALSPFSNPSLGTSSLRLPISHPLSQISAPGAAPDTTSAYVQGYQHALRALMEKEIFEKLMHQTVSQIVTNPAHSGYGPSGVLGGFMSQNLARMYTGAPGMYGMTLGMGGPGMQGMGMPPMGMQGMGMPPMGIQGMGMPPIGMQGMGMPPMGMQGMGMPPMGMQGMGMPPMGMQGMGMPQMGMQGMGMPPMGMQGMGMSQMGMGYSESQEDTSGPRKRGRKSRSKKSKGRGRKSKRGRGGKKGRKARSKK